jgi:hypothetical protein
MASIADRVAAFIKHLIIEVQRRDGVFRSRAARSPAAISMGLDAMEIDIYIKNSAFHWFLAINCPCKASKNSAKRSLHAGEASS